MEKPRYFKVNNIIVSAPKKVILAGNDKITDFKIGNNIIARIIKAYEGYMVCFYIGVSHNVTFESPEKAEKYILARYIDIVSQIILKKPE